VLECEIKKKTKNDIREFFGMNGNSFREWEGGGNENPHWREWESISLSRRPGVSNASNAKIPILVGRIGSGVRVNASLHNEPTSGRSDN